MKRLILCLAAGALSCSSYADDLAGLLAKPMSAGSVALLVLHSSEPGVRERWADALKDPRPEVRAAAARVINVSGTVALVEALKAVLTSEQDVNAADEEVRALEAFGVARTDEALSAAAKRFDRTRGVAARSLDLLWDGERAAKTQPGSILRTADGFPSGFVRSLLDATGCKPTAARGFSGGEIAFGKDGRPQTVSLLAPDPGAKPFGQPPACQEAAKTLLHSSIRFPAPEESRQMVLVMLSPDALECLAEDLSSEPQKVGGESEPQAKGVIREPKAVKRVNPVYPEGARLGRVQGPVVLHAIISPAGCVRNLKVLEGSARLNLAAMTAVSQWRYTPTLLDGKPVPVVMTVTVNFTLH